VNGDEQPVLAPSEDEDAAAQERAALEVEPARRLGARQPERLFLAGGRREAGEVDRWQGERRRRQDDLDGPPLGLVKDGAQRLVAADDRREGGRERPAVQPAGQAERCRNVVRRGAREQTVEEPEALLGEGEREGGRARGGRDAHLRRQLDALLGEELRQEL